VEALLVKEGGLERLSVYLVLERFDQQYLLTEIESVVKIEQLTQFKR
jgi:hypothetical protein